MFRYDWSKFDAILGLIFILALIVFVTYNDILRLL